MKEQAISVGDFSDLRSIRLVQADFSVVIDEYWIWTSEGPVLHGAVFPISYEEKIRSIVATRSKLKKDFDDSMSLVYELNNELARARNKT